jgi:polyketide biosynthesis enoyl-CoA hydratase PksI
MKLHEWPADESLVRVVNVGSGVRRIEMRDREGKNAFSPEFVSALLHSLDKVDRDRAACVAVLCGLGDIFCSGATREVLDQLRGGTLRPTELILGRKVLELQIPVIAACAGAALGGGLALAVACDFVVLAEDRRYGFNFMDLGITPGMGTTRLAEHFLGAATAHELLYSGELRRGSDLRASQVTAVVPSAAVEERALLLALRIADKPRRNLSLLKRTLTLVRRRRFEESMTLESLMHETSLEVLDLEGFPEREK